ncbi:lipocalin family protein [Palleronia abyssalis]|uniref:Outer membrane lipoprotein Blc n=1 Tax=Palleronia abyssalis TaxID=1501240 RepID=A0A2R8BYQ9_9RHOB|nr:lipocalin family protein [Palleronia abyssalis]SPJ25243.1 Outer membrane lipoprotein Blc [Palleronia abyssalis]
MHRLIVLAMLLAACSTESPLLPAPSYRDVSAPIASIASFDPDRFLGRWYEIASYPQLFQAGCRNTQAIYGAAPDGISVTNTCLRDGVPARIEGSATVIGPGRLEVRLDGVPFVSPFWILWVDEGYRTAVIGVPSGRAGWILNRDPEIPADRLTAAREILDFYGYDLAQLRMTPQDRQ